MWTHEMGEMSVLSNVEISGMEIDPDRLYSPEPNSPMTSPELEEKTVREKTIAERIDSGEYVNITELLRPIENFPKSPESPEDFEMTRIKTMRPRRRLSRRTVRKIKEEMRAARKRFSLSLTLSSNLENELDLAITETQRREIELDNLGIQNRPSVIVRVEREEKTRARKRIKKSYEKN